MSNVSFASWAAVGTFLKEFGIATAYIKQLARKQDNEKNQIYIAKRGLSPFAQLEQILPLEFRFRGSSTSTSKRRSNAGAPILEGTIKWNWVDRSGDFHPAPQTRAIFYLQYPEVRLSGFLKKCRNAPDALRRRKQAQFGARALVFGTGSNGEVFALTVTEETDPKLFPIKGLKTHDKNPLLYYLPIARGGLVRLLDDLKEINASGWHPSQRLKTAGQPPVPFRGTQGGGYTLESLLGIVSNANKEPDRDGIEVKSFSKSKVSLMTPAPDGGVQGKSGLKTFLDAYGRPDKSDSSVRNFNGTHKFGRQNKKTKLTLTVLGYNAATGFSGPEADVAVALVDRSTGIVAASWSYPRLFESWNKKHSQAVYVSAQKRPRTLDSECDADYHFADIVWVCEGTNSRLLLDAIIAGEVVYDPGDTSKSKKTKKPKARPQWRISNLKSLRKLYKSVKKIENSRSSNQS